MDNAVEVGLNRTGLDMAPLARDTLVDFARQQGSRGAPAQEGALTEERRAYGLEADAVGTVPVPARLKGMASTAMDTLKGNKPQVLIDKLGERLAYERTGVRLYEALIAKVMAATQGPIVDVGELQRIRDDELAHMQLVGRCLQELGADPTAMTPCADVSGVMATGHLQVLTDPRTTVAQALQSVLFIELGDNASWELLVELARGAGHEQMADLFTAPLATEQHHLQLVQGWLKQAVLQEAT
jgi:rubrerythrin